MAIQNLSTQYISASFQNLAQVSSSGDLYNGAGTQVTSLNINSTYSTTAGSAAAITGIDITSFATTGSNIFKSDQTIQGDVIITGNLTANQYVVSSSVYVVTQSFSSGSTVFGDDSLDTHQFTGSLSVLGAVTATSLTGSLSGNASTSTYATSAGSAGTAGSSLTANSASYALTASYAVNAEVSAVSVSMPYSGLSGTVPTWNQNTTGNAATATTASYAITASYISPTFISASAAASGFGTGGGSGALIVADEGSTLTSAAASINFAGNAVVASAVGNAVTVTIATGSAGGATSPGGNTGDAQFNNGGSFDGSTSLTFDGAGLVTKMYTRMLTQDDAEVYVFNHNLTSTTGAAPNDAYALSGTQVFLQETGDDFTEGQIVGVVPGGPWLPAASDLDISTGSLALTLKSYSIGEAFKAWLPGTVACVNLSSGPSANVWAAGSTAYPAGTVLYLDSGRKVLPWPTQTPGEHVRVIGHVYQNFDYGGDTFATFLFNPDGSWITL